MTPYKTLDTYFDATDELVEQAFRRLAQRLHPDKCADSNAAERFVQVCQAYELVLKMRAAGEPYMPDQSEVDQTKIQLGRPVRTRQGWLAGSA